MTDQEPVGDPLDRTSSFTTSWVLPSGGMDLTGLRGRRPAALSQEALDELAEMARQDKERAWLEDSKQIASHG